MPHICVSESGQQGFRQWHVAYLAPNHYLNQFWVIINWTIRNKLERHLSQKSNLFIQGNAFENVVCEMGTICFQGKISQLHKMDVSINQRLDFNVSLAKALLKQRCQLVIISHQKLWIAVTNHGIISNVTNDVLLVGVALLQSWFTPALPCRFC